MGLTVGLANLLKQNIIRFLYKAIDGTWNIGQMGLTIVLTKSQCNY